ncbi:MAG: hypothetical protein LBU65_05710 [Planctomycetaceae bacterium]|jgi:hypothetical protein|nr:hypothetical protein [Planctomycetaceae bacterium]
MSNTSTPSTNKRERLLIVIAGIMFLAMMIPLLNYLYGSSVSQMLQKRQVLNDEVSQLERTTRAKAVREQLAKYQSQSMPPSEDLATAKYQNWILKLGENAGFSESKVDRGSSRLARGVYKSYVFTYSGKATMKQLVTFLEQFRRYDNLQMIRSVTIKPSRSDRLDLSLTIETLALDSSPNKTFDMKMTQPEPDAKSIARMADTIVNRKFFTPYTPPQPSRPQQPPPRPPAEPPYFDPAPYCFVSVTIEKQDKPEVWIDYRTEGQQTRLTIGDKLSIGNVPCIVYEITFKTVGFAVDFGSGEGWKLLEVKVGHSFADANLIRDLPDFKP